MNRLKLPWFIVGVSGLTIFTIFLANSLNTMVLQTSSEAAKSCTNKLKSFSTSKSGCSGSNRRSIKFTCTDGARGQLTLNKCIKRDDLRDLAIKACEKIPITSKSCKTPTPTGASATGTEPTGTSPTDPAPTNPAPTDVNPTHPAPTDVPPTPTVTPITLSLSASHTSAIDRNKRLISGNLAFTNPSAQAATGVQLDIIFPVNFGPNNDYTLSPNCETNKGTKQFVGGDSPRCEVTIPTLAANDSVTVTWSGQLLKNGASFLPTTTFSFSYPIEAKGTNVKTISWTKNHTVEITPAP